MAYSESDTRANLIDQKLNNFQWKSSNIVREYYFTELNKITISQMKILSGGDVRELETNGIYR
ncbi:hypothetical protein PJV93_05765 [Aliarcobacter butzleri]|uniref:Uncharacterized protein n=1 Tax=Aliarcobacter butzleri TaxID=28197 RepID=A0AAW7QBY2_9BACT|nr:hypothetical protein [Aliarcobacter butzleri]MDN5106693.1 hypothetical protein [Aliarcobacter butzleri]MDN5123415.1 hypothetical protein [Aliarcobacter butzleri]